MPKAVASLLRSTGSANRTTIGVPVRSAGRGKKRSPTRPPTPPPVSLQCFSCLREPAANGGLCDACLLSSRNIVAWHDEREPSRRIRAYSDSGGFASSKNLTKERARTPTGQFA